MRALERSRHWRREAVAGAALACVLLAFPSTQATQEVTPPQLVTYAASNDDFANPERGFYRQVTPLWRAAARQPLDAAALARIRQADPITLVRAYYVIDEFRRAPLSPEVLEQLTADFAAVRRAGLKMIPRFTYNFPTNRTFRRAADASLQRVLGHVDQLAPVLRGNADVIAFMEAGFVGAWGEWHDSSNGFLNADRTVTPKASQVLMRLLDVLPPSRAVALRYPSIKQQLFGRTALAEDEAFTGTPRARLGAHNDCFASDELNGGTYAAPPEWNESIEDFKAFLSADNRYVPQGGEACGSDVTAELLHQPYVHCDSAVAEMARMRWSTIHVAYKPQVIALWKREGCFAEMRRRLGYRFRLLEGEYPIESRAGERLDARITLTNDGWAAPYNPRHIELVLRERGGTRLVRLPVDGDPRFWEPGETRSLALDVRLPADLIAGDYELLLNLPDPEPMLRARPEYSIRLANSDVWEAPTGFNRLHAGLRVTAATPAP